MDQSIRGQLSGGDLPLDDPTYCNCMNIVYYCLPYLCTIMCLISTVMTLTSSTDRLPYELRHHFS